MSQAHLLQLEGVLAARERIGTHLRATPAEISDALSRAAGRELWLKPEHRQRTGSFKVRGALSRISLIGEHAPGVVAASAGNHAQGVALAARIHGLSATIFMPTGASIPKVQATRDYGATVRLGGDSIEDCLELAAAHARDTGAVLIPPFDDAEVVAGQGTLGLELHDELPTAVDTLLVPVGGGGLIAGVAVALKALRPQLRIVGVQSAAVPSMRRSLEAGSPTGVVAASTIADGIAVSRPGAITYAHVARLVDEIVEVDDEQIGQAIVLLLERAKAVVEPAGSVGLAAVLAGLVRGSGPVGVVLSGGNVDPLLLAHLIEHGLSAAGRHVRLRILLPDRPGSLANVTRLVAEHGLNVLEVDHHRTGTHLAFEEVELFLTLESRGPAERDALTAALRAEGYGVAIV